MSKGLRTHFDDWSLLAENLHLLTDNRDAALGEKTQNHAIVGLAYRQTALNALARYENTFDEKLIERVGKTVSNGGDAGRGPIDKPV